MGITPITEDCKSALLLEYKNSTFVKICRNHGIEYSKEVKDRMKAVIGDSKRDANKGNLGKFHVRCACNVKAVNYEVIDGKRVCQDCPVYTNSAK